MHRQSNIPRASGLHRRSVSLEPNTWLSHCMSRSSSVSGISQMSTSVSGMRRFSSAYDITGRDASDPTKKKIDVKGMVAAIYRFLEEYQYEPLPMSPKEMNPIASSKVYFQMVEFVGKEIVGYKFFKKSKEIGQEPSTMVMELGSILKYPYKLQQSYFKSVNAPHSWPMSVLFLSWLCSRVRSSKELMNGNVPTIGLRTPESTIVQIGFPNVMELFLFNNSLRDASTLSMEEKAKAFEEKLRKELEAFRVRASETLNGVNQSVEELRAEQLRKRAELAQLKALPDPTKGFLEAVNIAEDTIQNFRIKLTKIQEEILICRSKRNSLGITKDDLQMKIQKEQSDIDVLNKKLRLQPLNKERAKELDDETVEIRKQRELIKLIISRLQTDLNKKLQFVQNITERTQQSMSKLSVVEEFNGCLSILKMDDLSVPANPLTASNDLYEWLNKVRETQEKTEKATQTLMETSEKDKAFLRDLEQNVSINEGKTVIRRSHLKVTTEQLNVEKSKFESQKKHLIAKLSRVSQKVEVKEAEVAELEKIFKHKSEGLKETNSKKDKLKTVSEAYNKGVCDWKDALLYLREKAIQIMEEKTERILDDFREFLKVKFEDDEEELKQKMENFEAAVPNLKLKLRDNVLRCGSSVNAPVVSSSSTLEQGNVLADASADAGTVDQIPQ